MPSFLTIRTVACGLSVLCSIHNAKELLDILYVINLNLKPHLWLAPTQSRYIRCKLHHKLSDLPSSRLEVWNSCRSCI